MKTKSPPNKLEEWKPVRGYEGIYEVSNQGRIRSLGRTVRTKNGKNLPVQPRVLKNCLSRTGYPSVSLCWEGEQKTHPVHRLVANTFWGPLDSEDCVHHKNADITDNRLSNLYIAPLTGEEVSSARLSEDEIKAIRTLHGVLTINRLGAIFGVSGATVSMIQGFQTWRHI